jgi:uncharacterized repeat protein (TIGR01451 family)
MSKSFFRVSTRLLVTTALVLGSFLSLAKSALAGGTPANTTITNQATSSFDATSTSTSGTTQSNTVNTITKSIPKLLLVKRITAINGADIGGFVDDSGTTDDNDSNWPDPNTTYLRGAINGGAVKPGDRLEYTIYFLSAGNTPITNITLCDLIPPNTTFVTGAYGSNSDIAFANSNVALPTTPSYLTGLFDIDRANFYPANTLPPTTCKNTSGGSLSSTDNTDGIVVVNVVTSPSTLPFATGIGTPPDSYGFVRFQVKVK